MPQLTAEAGEPVLEPGQSVGQLQVPQGLDACLADLQRVRVFGADIQLTLPHGHAAGRCRVQELVGKDQGQSVPRNGNFRLIGGIDGLKLKHLTEHRGEVVKELSIH